jgi:ribosome-associated protein
MTKTLPKTPPTSEADPSAALVTVALDALEDLKAVDIRTLDVRGLTTITDYMLIATGTSNRHVSALAHNVLDMARESGRKPVGVEGLAEGEWVLCNLGGVIVHVMQAQARAHYQLEKLWDLSPQEMVQVRVRQA